MDWKYNLQTRKRKTHIFTYIYNTEIHRELLHRDPLYLIEQWHTFSFDPYPPKEQTEIFTKLNIDLTQGFRIDSNVPTHVNETL